MAFTIGRRALLASTASLGVAAAAKAASIPPEGAFGGVTVSANGARDALGIGTHFNWQSGFPQWSRAQQNANFTALGKLGIKFIRDTVPNPNIGTDAVYAYLYQNYGIKLNMTVSNPNGAGDVDAAARLQSAYPGILQSIEGANEVNYKYSVGDARNNQAQLYRWAKGIPAIAPVPVLSFTSVGPQGIRNYGNMNGMADVANSHPYANTPPEWNGGTAMIPRPHMIDQLQAMQQTSPGMVCQATEWGWSHDTGQWSSAPLATQAGLVLSGWFDLISLGYQRGYLYQLHDDYVPFGILDDNSNLRPAGVAIQNMMALLHDGGNVTSITPPPVQIMGGCSQVGICFSDGSHGVVLWNEYGDTWVTVQAAGQHQWIDRLDPISGEATRWWNVNYMPVKAGANPVLVRLSAY